MEEEAMEMRLNGETQQKMVLSLQDEQCELNRQLTQLRLALQEKDGHIQCVSLCSLLYLLTQCAEYACFV